MSVQPDLALSDRLPSPSPSPFSGPVRPRHFSQTISQPSSSSSSHSASSLSSSLPEHSVPLPPTAAADAAPPTSEMASTPSASSAAAAAAAATIPHPLSPLLSSSPPMFRTRMQIPVSTIRGLNAPHAGTPASSAAGPLPLPSQQPHVPPASLPPHSQLATRPLSLPPSRSPAMPPALLASKPALGPAWNTDRTAADLESELACRALSCRSLDAAAEHRLGLVALNVVFIAPAVAFAAALWTVFALLACPAIALLSVRRRRPVDNSEKADLRKILDLPFSGQTLVPSSPEGITSEKVAKPRPSVSAPSQPSAPPSSFRLSYRAALVKMLFPAVLFQLRLVLASGPGPGPASVPIRHSTPVPSTPSSPTISRCHDCTRPHARPHIRSLNPSHASLVLVLSPFVSIASALGTIVTVVFWAFTIIIGDPGVAAAGAGAAGGVGSANPSNSSGSTAPTAGAGGTGLVRKSTSARSSLGPGVGGGGVGADEEDWKWTGFGPRPGSGDVALGGWDWARECESARVGGADRSGSGDGKHSVMAVRRWWVRWLMGAFS